MRFDDLLEMMRESDRSRLQYERRKAVNRSVELHDKHDEEDWDTPDDMSSSNSKRRPRYPEYDNQNEDFVPRGKKRTDRRALRSGWMGFDEND